MGRSPSDEDAGKPSDESLISAAIQGDEEAFGLLVGRHKRRVFRLASRFARNAHELDDICQEVFIRVYEHLGRFSRNAPFGHWLSRITINVCYDAIKKARRDRSHLRLEEVPLDWATVAEEGASGREAYETVMWGLERLRPEQRLVITLFELEEMPVREISELTGWSEGNVRVRAHRARQALKKILEVHHE